MCATAVRPLTPSIPGMDTTIAARSHLATIICEKRSGGENHPPLKGGLSGGGGATPAQFTRALTRRPALLPMFQIVDFI